MLSCPGSPWNMDVHQLLLLLLLDEDEDDWLLGLVEESSSCCMSSWSTDPSIRPAEENESIVEKKIT